MRQFSLKKFNLKSFAVIAVAVALSFCFSSPLLAASSAKKAEDKKKTDKKSEKKSDKKSDKKKTESNSTKKIDPKKGIGTSQSMMQPIAAAYPASPSNYKAPATRRIASIGAYSREDFYIDEKAELEKSLKKLVQLRAEKTAKLSQRLTASSDPWTASQTLKSSHTYLDPYSRSVTGQTTLKYSGVEGFVFQTYIDSYDSNFFGKGDTSRYSHNNYGFSLSQDLVALFGKSKYDFDVESAELQTKTKIISAESTFLSESLKLIDATNGLFSAYCKKFDNEIIFNQAQETLRVSEIQHSAKSITTKDLLRIQDTVLSLEKQKKSIEYEIMGQENFFATVSPEAYELARKLASVKVYCEENTDSLSKLKYPEKTEILEMVKLYPSLISIELSKESLKKQLELYNIQKKPAFSINLGQDRINNVANNKEAYNDNYVGVTFSYQFHGEQNSIYKQVLAEQQVDLNISQKQSTFDIQNYLVGLYNQLDNYLNQLPLSKRSTANAADLLKIIQTQQSIGQLDATAIDSAYSAYSQAISSEREILAQVTALVVKLNEIKVSSDRAAVIAKSSLPLK